MIKIHKLTGFKCLTGGPGSFSLKPTPNNLIKPIPDNHEGGNVRINGVYMHIVLTDFNKDLLMLDFLNIHMVAVEWFIEDIIKYKELYPDNKNFHILIECDDTESPYKINVNISHKKFKPRYFKMLKHYMKYDYINSSIVEKVEDVPSI